MSEAQKKKESEYKFLVVSEAWKKGVAGVLFRQGYLSTDPNRTVRVRLEGNVGRLTIKGRKIRATAPEFEYDIPVEDANYLLDSLCTPHLIETTRYRIRASDDLTWEVDEFHGINNGLVLAEIELQHESQKFNKPEWVGNDVTTDFRYANAELSKRPYTTWPESERQSHERIFD